MTAAPSGPGTSRRSAVACVTRRSKSTGLPGLLLSTPTSAFGSLPLLSRCSPLPSPASFLPLTSLFSHSRPPTGQPEAAVAVGRPAPRRLPSRPARGARAGWGATGQVREGTGPDRHKKCQRRGRRLWSPKNHFTIYFLLYNYLLRNLFLRFVSAGVLWSAYGPTLFVF